MELKQLQSMEETKWAQRSRIKWLKEEDKDTKFFHHTTDGRRSKNQISLLEIGGVELFNQDAISDYFAT